MFNPRRWVSLLSLVLLVGTLGGCDALKDQEPWTATLVYEPDATGKLTVTPLTLNANAAFGIVQVVNDDVKEHGFAITDHGAAIFEKIPAGKSRNVQVTELKDNLTYRFYCQIHDEDDGNGQEYVGKLVVKFLSEEFR